MTELLQDILKDLQGKITPAPTNNGEILKKLGASFANIREAREIQSAIQAPVPDRNRKK